MNEIEEVARVIAVYDDCDPDQPIKGFRQTLRQMIPVFRYHRGLPAWNYYVPLAKLILQKTTPTIDDK